jgi:DNA replication and repair protein RecF
VRVVSISLTDFRCYHTAQLALPVGVTAVLGENGQGKTSLLEGIAWAALGRSFRGVPDAALVRTGAEQAILRVAIEEAGGRARSVEAEIRVATRNRVLVDRHPLHRTRDLLGALRVTVFAPDDLELVKAGPAHRRDYLDELLVSVAPRYAAAHADYDRVLRHRNALLKGGVRDGDARTTLEVFDDQLVTAGAELVRGRLRLVARLGPAVDEAYRDLAGEGARVDTRYEADWAEGGAPDSDAVPEALRAALERLRRRELERGTTLVGPHRDEWRLLVGGLESRTHASQGEQRTLALSLRLAGHRVVAETVDDDPVLLLDDVFSELDDQRSRALVKCLPGAQTLVTTAGALPVGVEPEVRFRVADGTIGSDA